MAMSFELSDELAALATDFEQFTHGGIVMDGDTVFGVVAKLGKLRRLARTLETEVSRTRWNAAARSEREQRQRETSAVVDAISEPNSNVMLFPVIPRPFSDGSTHGAS